MSLTIFKLICYHFANLPIFFIFRSLLIHIQDWYEDLYWPYDEDETVLGIRYCISGILTASAIFILISTFFG